MSMPKVGLNHLYPYMTYNFKILYKDILVTPATITNRELNIKNYLFIIFKVSSNLLRTITLRK